MSASLPRPARDGAPVQRWAVFLDRDGTIIRDTEYIRDPDDVRLIDGAAAAIRRLNEQSVPVIVVTNQSGIARGLLTEQDYERVRMRLDRLLAAEGASVDASYHCPHHPDFGPACDCRKPGTLLYRRAVSDHGIDATRSFFVGDRLRDVRPGLELGGRGILLRVESTPESDLRSAGTTTVVDSLGAAVDLILSPRA
jgi:D-glycero-D-manno-heptose 1,7-bisphosphate phosphatase